MTMTALNGIMFPGFVPLGVTTSPAQQSMTIDASGEKAAIAFNPPRAGNIRKIWWGTRTVTTGDTVDVRVETVSSSFPSGTLWGTNTNASQVVDAANDNAVFTTTLTADAVVTRSSLIAVVIVAASGNMQISCVGSTYVLSGSNNHPRSSLYTTSWAFNANTLIVSLEYDDGEIWPAVPYMTFFNGATSRNYSTSSTPDEYGNVFVPSATFSCDAVWVVNSVATGTSPVIYLMDSSDTVLASATISNNYKSTGLYSAVISLDANVTLSAGQTYRLTYVPSTTSNCAIVDFEQIPSGIKLPLFSSMSKTTRTDAGAWTNDATVICSIFPVVSGIDGGAGGGLLTHPGMSGGMRG